MMIEKRDGSRVLFDANRIITAICQAAVDVDKSVSNETIQLAQSIAQDVYETLNDNRKKLYNVEDIQDMVIDHLNKSTRPDIGGAYSAYRQIRARQRERMEERERIIRDKLAARNVVNANANMDENSFSGRMSEARDVITKDIALHETMSAMAMRNHEENMIYTHDLNSYVIGSHNCLSIPFDDCLKNGVQVGETFLRPARSVNTAMQLVAVISQVQSQCQFGGTSSTHTDWTMVPYVRMSFRKHFKDGMKWIEHEDIPQDIIDRAPEDMSIEDEHYKQFKNAYEYAVEMTRKETYQAAEGLYHNLNSLKSRGGGQLKRGWLA